MVVIIYQYTKLRVLTSAFTNYILSRYVIHSTTILDLMIMIYIGYYFETHEVQLLYDFQSLMVNNETLKRMTWCNVTSKGLISSIES